jgi:hypothetical protein
MIYDDYDYLSFGNLQVTGAVMIANGIALSVVACNEMRKVRKDSSEALDGTA